MKKIISLFMAITLIVAASSISFTAYSFEKTMDDKVDKVSGATVYVSNVEEKKEEAKKAIEEKKEEARKAVEEKKKQALEDIIDDDKSDDGIEDDDSKEEDDDDEMDENQRKAKYKDEYIKSKYIKDLEYKLEELDDDDDDSNDTYEIKDLKKRVQEIKVESVKLRNEIRKAIRKSYSQEELAKLEALKAELIKEYEDIKVLDIDSVISNAAVFKFDTPPVIKNGRTLLPVSAITNGIGADIEWISADQKIIIKKGEDVIELWIDNNIALVNGIEVELDASPEIMNSRTIVPLRFILEIFKFKVEWNQEDETIEIIDEDAIEEDSDTVSGSAVDVTVSGSSTDVTVSGSSTDVTVSGSSTDVTTK
ncbi:MAG: copper amine oxidase N-terminal domain-containing protein [Acidaminobacteraceae bacterium]